MSCKLPCFELLSYLSLNGRGTTSNPVEFLQRDCQTRLWHDRAICVQVSVPASLWLGSAQACRFDYSRRVWRQHQRRAITIWMHTGVCENGVDPLNCSFAGKLWQWRIEGLVSFATGCRFSRVLRTMLISYESMTCEGYVIKLTCLRQFRACDMHAAMKKDWWICQCSTRLT